MDKIYGRTKKFRFLGNDFEEFIPEEFRKLEETFKILNEHNDEKCANFKYGNPSNFLDKTKEHFTKYPVPLR
jgi:hypothetical protein